MGNQKEAAGLFLTGTGTFFTPFFFKSGFFSLCLLLLLCVYIYLFCLFVCWYLTYCNLLAWVLVWMFAHAAKLLLRQNQLTLSQNLS
jgi:hypothetical protein